jgi:UDP-glucose 4-epimerase
VEQHQPAAVLVTGGAGFIGRHLVERLVARGDTVTVVDLHPGSDLAGVERHLGDCTLAADLLARGSFDLLFHLGAPAYVPPSVDDPIADLRANVEQTLYLLQALRAHARPARMIHVSSAAIYGQPPVDALREDMPPAPVSPYGIDKFAAEEHVRVAAALHGLEAAILRYFPVYGPGQRKQVVYDLIMKMLDDPTRIEVFGDGSERRDFIYVDDVVEATLLVAEKAPARGEAYNVGTGTEITIADVVAEVGRALGLDPRIDWTGDVRPGDSTAMVADISRISALGFAPSVSFPDGVKNTAAWVQEVRA